MFKFDRRTLAAGAAALALLASAPALAQGTKTLKFVQAGNLTILDPIFTTAYVTRDHGYMIYDTLFSSDENNVVKPQMVDKHEVSADKTLWTFTLRDGLEWHDGKPVTAEDCVPSIKRWAARDSMGQKLMDFIAEMKVVNDKTFTIKLKEPYGLVLDSLGKPSSNVPFMMPKRLAEMDPFKAIDSQVGSGPFIYVNAESKPGEKHVYVKNSKYKPRAEPPSGLAGGKVAKVDRVEFVDMSDPQQQINALITGEIDMIENIPHDLIPIIKKDKNVQTVDWNPLGQQFTLRLNHLTKPFDNLKIRQAAFYSMRQEDYLKATVGEKEFYKVCTAAFVCGTPNGVEIKGDLLVKPDFEKSKQLLKEAGYDGTPVVLMHSTTLPTLTNMAPVTKALLEQGGFKVDMQSMDWQTVVSRRARKDPADKGGWSAFHTYAIAVDILNPIAANWMIAEPNKAWFGWPNDPDMEKLRDSYARETDPAKAKAIAAAIQQRAIDQAQYIWLGMWFGPGAARANVVGWLKAPVTVLWNIEKK
jgi:peptide/nickel transport system substrate-binding protein